VKIVNARNIWFVFLGRYLIWNIRRFSWTMWSVFRIGFEFITVTMPSQVRLGDSRTLKFPIQIHVILILSLLTSNKVEYLKNGLTYDLGDRLIRFPVKNRSHFSISRTCTVTGSYTCVPIYVKKPRKITFFGVFVS